MIIELKAFKVKETGELYGWHTVKGLQPDDERAAWKRLGRRAKTQKLRLSVTR